MGVQGRSISLSEYMRIIYEMEASVYEQTQLLSKLSSEYQTIPKNSPNVPKRSLYEKRYFIAIAIILCGIVLGLIVSGISNFVGSMRNQVGGISMASSSSVFETFITISEAIAITIFLALVIINQKSKDIPYRERLRSYRSEMELYLSTRPILQELERDIPCVHSKLNESQQLLSQFYNLNIIYPRYRNFVAVSTILEYLESGRCSELEGANGAYNLYENEIRWNKVITNLNTIVAQLNQIQSNQHMICTAIDKCNRNITRLYDSIQRNASRIGSQFESISSNTNKILQNSEILTYQSELIEKEIAYRNRMQYGVNYR